MSTYIQPPPPDNTKVTAERRSNSASPALPRQLYDDINNNADSYERLLRLQRIRANRPRGERPPYAIHEHMWHRQQLNQELLRRNMTPLNLSTNSSHGDLCACEIRHPRRAPRPRSYSIRVNHATPVAYPPVARSQVHHHVFYRPNYAPDPQVHLSIGVDQRDSNLLSSLNQFVRVLETTRRFMGQGRGATREVIERNTFPHKYKRIRRNSTTDDDDMEKCTICLSQFEIEHEVRYD